MRTFEVREKTTTTVKYGIQLITGVCLWFDTREERDDAFFALQA